jgi:5'(3')-deoxyribonucleotidase
MIIYLDMDDVVADWMGLAKTIVNRNWNYGERIPDSDWKKLKYNPRFYRNIPLKKGAVDLVNYCRNLLSENKIDGLYFLTALPHDYSMPHAAYDKVLWAQEHFPDIPVFFGPFSHDKWRHCTPGDILIDDRSSNVSEWISAGGIAHRYTTWENCKPWLEEIFK